MSAKCNRLRVTLLNTVTIRDMRALIAKLVELGKAGDVSAIREILSRCLGPVVATDLLERIESLESRLIAKSSHGHDEQ